MNCLFCRREVNILCSCGFCLSCSPRVTHTICKTEEDKSIKFENINTSFAKELKGIINND